MRMSVMLRYVWWLRLLLEVLSVSTLFSHVLQYVSSDSASWVTRDNHYYYFSRGTKKAYYEASKYCRSLGAQLTSIVNHDETDFMRNHISSDSVLNSQEFWIGVYKHERIIYGTPYFLDGTPLNYTNFHNNEPNEKFCCIRMDEHQEWRDKACSLTYNFICKKPHTHRASVSTHMRQKLIGKWVMGVSMLVEVNNYCSRLYCAALCLKNNLCAGYNFRKIQKKCSCELKGSEYYLTRSLGVEEGSSYWE